MSLDAGREPGAAISEPESDLGKPVPKKSRWRLAAWSGTTAAVGLVVLYLVIASISAHVLTLPRSCPVRLDPSRISTRHEPWSAVCEDGVKLKGWFFPSVSVEAGPRPLIVLVHGLGQSRQSLAGQARGLVELGYNVLLFDLRGHGESDPERISLGHRERRDLRAVLKWAGKHGFPPERTGWVGYSMGGAALLMEAADNPKIRVVAVDSAFGNLPEVLDPQLSVESGLPRFFNPGILFAAAWLFDTPVADLLPAESARKWRDRPLLLIHGEADRLVPKRQAQAIARAAGPTCQTVFVPHACHCGAYKYDPRSYVNRLDQFFREHLAPWTADLCRGDGPGTVQCFAGP